MKMQPDGRLLLIDWLPPEHEPRVPWKNQMQLNLCK